MRQDLSDNILDGIDSDPRARRYLIELGFPSVTRLTTSGRVITWNGTQWVPYGIDIAGLDDDGNAGQKLTLRIDDPDLAMAALILGDGIADRQIKVWRFYGDGPLLSSLDPLLIFSGVGDQADGQQNRTIQVTAVVFAGNEEYTPNTFLSPSNGFNYLPRAGDTIPWDGVNYVIESSES